MKNHHSLKLKVRNRRHELRAGVDVLATVEGAAVEGEKVMAGAVAVEVMAGAVAHHLPQNPPQHPPLRLLRQHLLDQQIDGDWIGLMIVICLSIELMGHLVMVMASMSMCSTQVSAQHMKTLAGVQFQHWTVQEDHRGSVSLPTHVALV